VTSPVFSKVIINLDKKYCAGTTFTIVAKNNSPQNKYIQSALLNGKPHNQCWLRHETIAAGGTLELVMGPEPNKSWGTGE